MSSSLPSKWPFAPLQVYGRVHVQLAIQRSATTILVAHHFCSSGQKKFDSGRSREPVNRLSVKLENLKVYKMIRGGRKHVAISVTRHGPMEVCERRLCQNLGNAVLFVGRCKA